MKPKIVAHTLVKNEERFIWYALQSVLPYVDKIMVWDTGSTDDTVKIINSIKSKKISFKSVGSVTSQTHTLTRQRMLESTPKSKYDWLLLLDGDEIWPEDQIIQSIEQLNKLPKSVNTVIVHTRNLVGDIYHQLPESAGQYTFAGKTGHLALRFIRLSTEHLNVRNPHGRQAYSIGHLALQDQDQKHLAVFDTHYYHTTHLPRSSQDRITLKRSFKRKLELGEKVSINQLPKIFFKKHPKGVPDVSKKMGPTTFIISLLLTIPRRLKRLLITPPSGY